MPDGPRSSGSVRSDRPELAAPLLGSWDGRRSTQWPSVKSAAMTTTRRSRSGSQGSDTSLTVSNAPFTGWRRYASTADARSSGMESRRRATTTVARIARVQSGWKRFERRYEPLCVVRARARRRGAAVSPSPGEPEQHVGSQQSDHVRFLPPGKDSAAPESSRARGRVLGRHGSGLTSLKNRQTDSGSYLGVVFSGKPRVAWIRMAPGLRQ